MISRYKQKFAHSRFKNQLPRIRGFLRIWKRILQISESAAKKKDTQAAQDFEPATRINFLFTNSSIPKGDSSRP